MTRLLILPRGSRRLSEATRAHGTLTELAYVPDSAPDGWYLLSLQIAPFVAEATPGRRVLLPLRVAR